MIVQPYNYSLKSGSAPEPYNVIKVMNTTKVSTFYNSHSTFYKPIEKQVRQTNPRIIKPVVKDNGSTCSEKINKTDLEIHFAGLYSSLEERCKTPVIMANGSPRLAASTNLRLKYLPEVKEWNRNKRIRQTLETKYKKVVPNIVRDARMFVNQTKNTKRFDLSNVLKDPLARANSIKQIRSRVVKVSISPEKPSTNVIHLRKGDEDNISKRECNTSFSRITVKSGSKKYKRSYTLSKKNGFEVKGNVNVELSPEKLYERHLSSHYLFNTKRFSRKFDKTKYNYNENEINIFKFKSSSSTNNLVNPIKLQSDQTVTIPRVKPSDRSLRTHKANASHLDEESYSNDTELPFELRKIKQSTLQELLLMKNKTAKEKYIKTFDRRSQHFNHVLSILDTKYDINIYKHKYMSNRDFLELLKIEKHNCLLDSINMCKSKKNFLDDYRHHIFKSSLAIFGNSENLHAN